MRVFVFQSMPERYDLRIYLEADALATWYATRHRQDMRPGDIVFFWMGGHERFRGLYGWGTIEAPPYIKPEWQSHGVDVRYKVRFKNPIVSSFLKKDAELAKILLFRAPQATNFLLTNSQARRLVSVIRKEGEVVPDLVGLSDD